MKKFKLFACCIPVKGISRSILYDLQRFSFHFIPLGLYEILSECKDMNTDDIKVKYNNCFDGVIDEYFEYLIEKEYGFYCDNPENFPNLSLEFETPEIINNVVIDVSNQSMHDFEKIFLQFDYLGCKYLELRFFDETELSQIVEILKLTKYTRLKNVDILVKHIALVTEDVLYDTLISANPIIGNIIIHSSPIDKYFDGESKYFNIKFSNKKLLSSDCCGNISACDFNINLKMFTESLKYNTCLNKKLSIDVYGNIKNCPSLKESFGNHKNIDFKNVVFKEEYQKFWLINKDQIKICKDCEFRYMCTDCRAFLTNEYDKPLKCSYDPFTMQWN